MTKENNKTDNEIITGDKVNEGTGDQESKKIKEKEQTEKPGYVNKRGFDPKNRPVYMFGVKGNYRVLKTSTDFSERTTSKTKAEQIFQQQINCSQNQ